jgi:aminopeptidase N
VSLVARRLVLCLSAVLVGSLLGPASGPGGSAAVGAAPTAVAGSAGIGDRYYPFDGNGGYDVTHYDIHDTYRHSDRLLSGWTDISLTARETLSSFHLDLMLRPTSVTIDGQPASYRKSRPHELVVTPSAPVARGSKVVVRVHYRGKPGRLTYAGERPWLDEGGEATATNEPHMAPWWFPANDHPRDKARFDITFSAPAAKKVISNGTLVGTDTSDGMTTWHWRMPQRMATYLAFVAVGGFRVEQGVYHGRPWYDAVSTDYSQDTQDAALRLLRNTPRMVEWLEGQFGTYPFDTTGGVVVWGFRGFALENQSRPTYPFIGNDSEARLTVLHELAHQWFGDDVSVAHWRDIWLNEGFATWAEWRYLEAHGGISAQRQLLRSYRARPASRSFWHLHVAAPGPARMFDEPVYVRGAMTLQALRHRIGRATFRRLLRTWVDEHQGGGAGIRQFEALARRVSGQHLHGFFHRWLHSGVRPPRTKANGLR